MIGTILASALALLTPGSGDDLKRCGVDADEVTRLLALPWEHFDQQPDGWRAIAKNTDCSAATADLITLYLAASTALPQPDPHGVALMRWHAGQMRARAGQTEAAMALMRGAYDPPENPEAAGWSTYVDATLAFLEGRRDDLERANARLQAMPIPDGETAPGYVARSRQLVACFGRSYADMLRREGCAAS